MNNFREVNDDILRDWLSFREEMVLGTLTKEDKKHLVYFCKILHLSIHVGCLWL